MVYLIKSETFTMMLISQFLIVCHTFMFLIDKDELSNLGFLPCLMFTYGAFTSRSFDSLRVKLIKESKKLSLRKHPLHAIT